METVSRSHVAGEWCAEGLNSAVADSRAHAPLGPSHQHWSQCVQHAVLGTLPGGGNCVLGIASVKSRNAQAREEGAGWRNNQRRNLRVWKMLQSPQGPEHLNHSQASCVGSWPPRPQPSAEPNVSSVWNRYTANLLDPYHSLMPRLRLPYYIQDAQLHLNFR